MSDLERVYGAKTTIASDKIPSEQRPYIQELADYVEYHPCASTLENLAKGVVDVLVKTGKDAESAKRAVGSWALGEFLSPNKVDVIRKRLSEAVERLRRNGYMEWAEKEAYALFRIDQPDAEALQKLNQWKKQA